MLLTKQLTLYQLNLKRIVEVEEIVCLGAMPGMPCVFKLHANVVRFFLCMYNVKFCVNIHPT